MPIELKMPALSPTMEKGSLAKWLVKIGDAVKPGDLLAEIETDKATMEFESADEGILAEILIPEGSDDVTVGTVIALLGDASDVAAAKPAPVAAVAEAKPAPAPAPEAPIAITPRPDPVPAAAPAPIALSGADRARVSPLARRIAEASGIDVRSLTGTGAGGKVIRADLGLKPRHQPQIAATVPSADVLPAAPVYAAPQDIPFETIKLSNMRRTIARRLTQSKQTVPHFYLSIDCKIDPLLKLRQELNADLADSGVKLSVNDFLVKALALALTSVPDANVQFASDEMYRFSRVDIAVAVAIEGGLITPVIRDVANKRLSKIAGETKQLAGLARDGKLLPEQYQGGTASISNLGMYGIERIFPVINPPQAMILGVGAGEERPYAVGGELKIGTMLTMIASFDHRAIDGAVGAELMAALRGFIDRPITMIA